MALEIITPLNECKPNFFSLSGYYFVLKYGNMFVARRWTFSGAIQSFLYVTGQTLDTYSRWDLACDLKRCRNESLFRYKKFFLIIPRFLFAVLTQYWICNENLSLLSKVTPKSFSSWTVSMGSPL